LDIASDRWRGGSGGDDVERLMLLETSLVYISGMGNRYRDGALSGRKHDTTGAKDSPKWLYKMAGMNKRH